MHYLFQCQCHLDKSFKFTQYSWAIVQIHLNSDENVFISLFDIHL